MTRPEIAARDGVYPTTEAGRQAISDFHDVLDELTAMGMDMHTQIRVLHAHLRCLIEQHNASWDQAVIDSMIAPREPAKTELKEPPHGS